MDDQNLAALFIKQADRFSAKAALHYKKEGRYRDVTYGEFKSFVASVVLGLRGLGIEKGDRVAILSENRPEWFYADLAVLALGGIVVPIHATTSQAELEHILSHSGAKAIFVSTAERFEHLKPILKSLPDLKTTVLFEEPDARRVGVPAFRDLSAEADACSPKAEAALREGTGGVGPDDPASIIYTSGTTGLSKGVVLTHRNLLQNCFDAKEALPITERDTSLSFLPLSHVFERMAGCYLAILCGSTVAFAESMNTVPENMKEVRPTLACAAPRFFEKTRAQIERKVSESGFLVRLLFQWALRVGGQVQKARREGRAVSVFDSIRFETAKRLVFSKIRKTLGGKIRFFVSGGAPLARELAEFFHSLDILVLEGYGLTETSPVLTVNRADRYRFGSVGLPLAHAEVKIAEGGEIATRGPSVMKGYYRDEKETAAVIRGGWFYTGDLGRLDNDGFLYIIGRKKDIIVTSAGKNVAPQNIENAILGDPAISQIVIVGDKHNYLTALVVPDFEEARLALAIDSTVPPSELVRRADVHQLIRSRITARTGEFASYEQVKYFTLLAGEFSQGKNEMTLTLKIKRQIVQEHYSEAIRKMYERAETDADDRGHGIFYVV